MKISLFVFVSIFVLSFSFAPARPVLANPEDPDPSGIFVSDSAVLGIYEPSGDVRAELIILPGFGEGFPQYSRTLRSLLAKGYRVGMIVSRARDGIGIHVKDLSRSIRVFQSESTLPQKAFLLAHSISAVWIMRYLQTEPRPEKWLHSVVLTNPVLQPPILQQECFAANSERRCVQLSVHIRLGRQEHHREIEVREFAGHMRDLMKAMKLARGSDILSRSLPVIAIIDTRDPVLRDRENLALAYLRDQSHRARRIMIVEGTVSQHFDAHNLPQDARFMSELIPGGEFYHLLRPPIHHARGQNRIESCAGGLNRFGRSSYGIVFHQKPELEEPTLLP